MLDGVGPMKTVNDMLHIPVPKVASKRKSHTQLLLHMLSQAKFNAPTGVLSTGRSGSSSSSSSTAGHPS